MPQNVVGIGSGERRAEKNAETMSMLPPLTLSWILLVFFHLKVPSALCFVASFDKMMTSVTSSSSTLSFEKKKIKLSTWTTVRGGSTTSFDDDEDEEEDSEEKLEDEAVNDEESGEEEEHEGPLDTVISSEPLTVTVKTNLGSVLVDTSWELMGSRSRNIYSIKRSLSRLMPGRPPVSGQRLALDGKLLENDLLVDELIDDDEDDEESTPLSLLLDIVPPVDPKFATDMDRIKEMGTSDILDAYAANAVGMYHNSQLLLQPEERETQVNLQLRREAQEIRQQLLQNTPESFREAFEAASENKKEDAALRPRGQRQRTGRGGASQNVKRVLQRNLNINWSDTVRNFMLFLFFGFFGGRNSVSKHLLLLGAPLCFVLQARPVKIWLKQIFYCCKNPPSILLSLLPAPQQAILSFHSEQSLAALYGQDDRKVKLEHFSEEEDVYDDTEEGYDEC